MEPFALRPTERIAPMSRRQAAPPKYPEFSRRFRQVVLGKTQEEVANEIGCTPGYVGQFLRGASRPAYKLAEEIVQVYSLPRDEWMAIMGHGPEPDPADEREAIALRAAETALRGFKNVEAQVDVLTHVLRRYHQMQLRHPNRLVSLPDPDDGLLNLTLEEADSIIDDIERDLDAEAS